MPHETISVQITLAPTAIERLLTCPQTMLTLLKNFHTRIIYSHSCIGKASGSRGLPRQTSLVEKHILLGPYNIILLEIYWSRNYIINIGNQYISREYCQSSDFDWLGSNYGLAVYYIEAQMLYVRFKPHALY